ncbi:hypothetical protein FDECE_616 [Fusarium decemcellulare]|nr:hypothetical protein FDECE_616 [Fusarium decemcellulare]
MDPVSLTLGVVSLAMQLMQTAAAIKRLIAAYKSATRELMLLSDKLDDIEAVCNSLGTVLDNFDHANEPLNTTLIQKLHKVISECHDKVSSIYDIINKVISNQKHKPIAFRTIGARFLTYKDQIRQCTRDLDRSLSSLQLHMTTNILAFNMTRSVRPPEMRYLTSGHASVNAQGVDQMSISQVCVPRRNIDSWDISLKHDRWGWDEIAYLQKTQTQRAPVGVDGPPFSSMQRDLTFFACAPLFGLYIQLSVQYGSLFPFSVSIEMPSIIDALLVDGLITPSTTVMHGKQYHLESEISLYGFATLSRAHSISQFLIQYTPDLLQRGGLLSPYEFTALLNGAHDIDYVRSCMNLCKAYFSDRWGPFNLCVWAHVIQAFLNQDEKHHRPFQNEQWAPLVSEVMSCGIDLHTATWPASSFLTQDQSALQQLLRSTHDPDVALQLVHSWVEFLEQVGVNTQDYLEIEIERCARTFPTHYCINRYTSYHNFFMVQEFDGRRLPSWIEAIDYTCPVRDLFMEFPQFKLRGPVCHRRVPYGYQDSHQVWKDPHAIGFDDSDLSSWPVLPPLCRRAVQHLRGRLEIHEEDIMKIEGLDRACDLMETRFERKQRRKLLKAGYTGRRVLNSAMPGTWID